MAVKLIVHRFKLGDVDDPEIYAAAPIWDWQQTEAGKWVMENSLEKPVWQQRMDYHSYQHEYCIVAILSDEDATWYRLKYDSINCP